MNIDQLTAAMHNVEIDPNSTNWQFNGPADLLIQTDLDIGAQPTWSDLDGHSIPTISRGDEQVDILVDQLAQADLNGALEEDQYAYYGPVSSIGWASEYGEDDTPEFDSLELDPPTSPLRCWSSSPLCTLGSPAYEPFSPVYADATSSQSANHAVNNGTSTFSPAFPNVELEYQDIAAQLFAFNRCCSQEQMERPHLESGPQVRSQNCADKSLEPISNPSRRSVYRPDIDDRYHHWLAYELDGLAHAELPTDPGELARLSWDMTGELCNRWLTFSSPPAFSPLAHPNYPFWVAHHDLNPVIEHFFRAVHPGLSTEEVNTGGHAAEPFCDEDGMMCDG